MMGVDTGSPTGRLAARMICLGLSLGWRAPGAVLHSSNEAGELSYSLYHDDNAINVVLVSYCRRESCSFHADIVMSLEDIFGYIFSKKWTNLDKTWQKDVEWGKSDPVKYLGERSGSHRERGKIPTLFVMKNTTHPFGHFRFTDFLETWQEHVNPCAGVR